MIEHKIKIKLDLDCKNEIGRKKAV
jgi:hypothetical protein